VATKGQGQTEEQEATVDGDALSAARLEAAGERTFRLGGRLWRLRSELPFAAAEVWRAGERRAVVEMVLEDPSETDEFMALFPSEQDVGALFSTFGVPLGK
jgi:hypothetical protein